VPVRNPAALKPGLVGEYFGGINFDNPGLRRIDSEARFTMRDGQTWPGGPPQFVSWRWRGYLKIPETGPYMFQVWCSDGLRLLIDNTEILANWSFRKVSFDTGSGILQEGYHQFVLEGFCSSGWGGATFSFKKSGDSGDAKTGSANFFYDPLTFTPLQQSATPDHFDSESIPGAQEAETLPVLECSSIPPFSIPFGRKKGILLWGKKPKAGDRLKLRKRASGR